MPEVRRRAVPVRPVTEEVAEVGVPADHEREAVARVLVASINAPLERTLERSAVWHLEDMRVARIDGAVASVAAEVRFHQWFGGRPVECSGIWGVGTLPEHRGAGLASAVTGELLDHARARGDAITALFPAVLPPYRRLGFEVAGTFLHHQVDLDALPAFGPSFGGRGLPTVENADAERDVDAIRELFSRWVKHHNGPVSPRDAWWWTERWLSDPLDPSFRALIVRGDDGLEGFTTVSRQSTTGPLGDVSFGLTCDPLVAITERALHALLDYLRAHRGIGRWARWSAPPQDPMALVLPEVQPATAMRYLWMLRVLDVERAFTARGYPPIDADVTFAVDDPRYEENGGGWRLRLAGGHATIERTDVATTPIRIGVLSSMYSGFLRVDDAVMLGHLAAQDPSVDGLRTILAGPDPWTPWWF